MSREDELDQSETQAQGKLEDDELDFTGGMYVEPPDLDEPQGII